MPDGEIILYTTEDGEAEIQLRATDGTVWLTQARMAELFATSPQAITQLIRSIYEDAELTEEATCNEFLQVRSEGGRQVRRSLRHYNLEMILAVGYRVSAKHAKRLTHDRYAAFDEKRETRRHAAAEAEERGQRGCAKLLN